MATFSAFNSKKIAIGGKGSGGFTLTGGLKLTNLGGVDVSASFDSLAIRLDDNKKLTADINGIGLEMGINDYFSFAADMKRINDKKEFGYAGGMQLSTDLLPKLSGRIKWVKVRTESGNAWADGGVLYVEHPMDKPLMAGFFLRSLGVGLGVNQQLIGLGPAEPGETLLEQLIRLVSHPKGLPSPMDLNSWKAWPPKSTTDRNFLLVGTGYITLGKFKRNKKHPLAGNILLTLDKEKVTADVNLWFFASPAQISAPEFQSPPVARGALGISFLERSISGALTTVKNPDLSPDAPEVVKLLTKLEATLIFRADENGFLMECGWPDQIRFAAPSDMRPFKGEMSTGMRFGIYRGAVAFGLNQGIDVSLNLGTGVNLDAGVASVGVELKLIGEAHAKIGISGGIKPDLSPLLSGGMSVMGQVEIRASCRCKVGGPGWSPVKINIDKSISIGINATLSFAMDNAGFGFDGTVRGSIPVRGHELKGRFAFSMKKNKIDDVRRELNSLLPRLPSMPQIRTVLESQKTEPFVFESNQSRLDEPVEWHYDLRRRSLSDSKVEVRVLLFPSPDWNYPRYKNDNLPHRFKIPIRERRESFDNIMAGFLGRSYKPCKPWNIIEDENGEEKLCWNEHLEKVIQQGEIPNKDITLGHFLNALEKDARVEKIKEVELSDPRSWGRSPGDTFDCSSDLAPGMLSSPYLKPDTLYDELLAEACRPQKEDASSNDGLQSDEPNGMSSSLLFTELVGLQRDNRAKPGFETRRYSLAPYVHCILVFNVEKNTELAKDPMVELFDLSKEVLLAGKLATLKRAMPKEKCQFSLVGRPSGADEDSISLVWDFKVEGQKDPCEAYKYLEFFRITRSVGKSSKNSRSVDVHPCRVKAPGKKHFNGEEVHLYFRVPHDFIDRSLEGIALKDVIYYRIEAIGREDDEVLASTEFPVEREFVRPLAPPLTSDRPPGTQA